jgi:hypothetical protein
MDQCMRHPIFTVKHDTQILHPGSRSLFAYWESLRAERACPNREEFAFEPVKDLMPDMVVLEQDLARGGYSFRLAGSRVCALFGRNLTASDAFSGWDAYETSILRNHFKLAFDNFQPILFRMRLLTDTGITVAAELIAMPIRARMSNRIQLIGGLFSFCDVSDLAYHSIQTRELVSARAIWTEHGSGELGNSPDVPFPYPQKRSNKPFLKVLEGGKSR